MISYPLSSTISPGKSHNLPGGCIFITLSVELHGHELPHMASELGKGFASLKAMINGFLDEAKEAGHINDRIKTSQETELIFCGLIGAAVLYGRDKSSSNLHRTIGALIDHLKYISV